MNKNLKLKKTMFVMFIISVALLVCFAAAYFFQPVHAAGQIEAGVENLKVNWQLISESFVFPFDANKSEFYTAFCNEIGANVALILSVINYVITGLTLIVTVLGIIYIINKKKPLFIIYVIALLAALYVAFIMVTYGTYYLALAQDAFAPGNTEVVWHGVFAIAVFVLGILAFASVIATVVIGLIYAGKSYAEEKVEEPVPASVAEMVGDPEAVQEGEELVVADTEAVIEKEPEPIPEEAAEDEPIPEEEDQEEPTEEPTVQEEPKEEKQHVEVNVNNANPGAGIDQASLASLLREVVRDIVRDEIARSSLNQPQQPQQNPTGNQTITGATFGGPLVVQYFNGGINGVSTPAPAVVENKSVEKVVEIHKEPSPQPEPTPAPAPVVEEKKEEPKPAPRPLFVKKEAVAKPVEEQPAPEEPKVETAPAPEKKEYERISFVQRLLQSEKDVHELYNELKNEILSYGVKSRISAVGDTFRLHKKMYVRITVAGKSLKLYFALNPADYANSTLPIQDASDKDMYQEIPLVFKVKSPLSVRRCKELIQDVMEKDGLEQGEVGKVNWIKELKAELASGKKPKKEEE